MNESISAIRKAVLALKGNRRTAVVTVRDVGELHVRELTAADRAHIEELMFRAGEDKSGAWKLVLVARSLYDPVTQAAVFDDADLEHLGELPARVMDPVFAAAYKLSGLGPEAVEEAKGN